MRPTTSSSDSGAGCAQESSVRVSDGAVEPLAETLRGLLRGPDDPCRGAEAMDMGSDCVLSAPLQDCLQEGPRAPVELVLM